jgi:hypothetical protein
MMIFQHTWQQVLDGSKTQTRRISKPGEELRDMPVAALVQYPAVVTFTISSVFHWNWTPKPRVKWQVGRTYAVQPGRGKKAVGRIRLTGIRQERVQDITEDDARAEGCHIDADVTGEPFGGYDVAVVWARTVYAHLWDAIHNKCGERWADNPLVWVLTFELVEAA